MIFVTANIWSKKDSREVSKEKLLSYLEAETYDVYLRRLNSL